MRSEGNKIILYNGDCLIESDKIESGSVDLILTDLPYGTVKNAKFYDYCGGVQWDVIIDTKKIMQLSNRILRRNGKMVLFAQQPFSNELMNNALTSLPYSYTMIWKKDHFANSLIAKKAPVNYYEDILVFSKAHPKHDFEGAHPLREYFKQIREYIKATTKEIDNTLGNSMSSYYFTNGVRFLVPAERDYNKLVQAYRIDRMEGFKPLVEVKAVDTEYRQNLIKKMNEQYPSTFNLWEGNKYKSNILEYKKDYDGLHPTQKPVSLLEDLVKTFSNEGDLVVDLTMGSGSTGVACKNTNRSFIGIEMSEQYFKIAEKRIYEAVTQLKLF